MAESKKSPVTLKVEIDHNALKKLVEAGRLMEFVTVFPSLASQHIRAQVVDQVALAAVGSRDAHKNISIAIGFDIDDEFGTPPKPGPWWKYEFGEVFEKVIDEVINRQSLQR